MQKYNKIRYIHLLAKDAPSAYLWPLILVLASTRCIRKYKLQRLFDGIITSVAVFLFAEVTSISTSALLSVIIAISLGCYTVISGGFIIQTE